MKIKRREFMGLAMSLWVAPLGCAKSSKYGNVTPNNPSIPASKSVPAPQPTAECYDWDASGECISWDPNAPTVECYDWDATGECISYEDPYAPTIECLNWDATGECTLYEVDET